MKPEEYFIKAIQSGLFKKFDYMLALFTEADSNVLKPIPYAVFKSEKTYGYYDENLEIVDLGVPHKGRSLFNYRDELYIPKGSLANVSEDTISTYGNFYVNAAIANSAGKLIPFIKGKIGGGVLSDMEDLLAQNMVDDTEDNIAPEGKITVSDAIELLSNLQTLEALGPYVVQAATVHNIQPPKGLKKFKKKLIKKYGDKLKDPIYQVKFVKELQDFDAAWLDKDGFQNDVVSGKIRKVARTKMFLVAGNTPNFTDEQKGNFVIDSFSDGGSDNKKDIATVNSGVRYASYARGVRTAEGGTMAKAIMQIFSPVTVVKGDCGTKLTVNYKVTNKSAQWVGRYFYDKGKLKRVTTESFKDYVGKTLPFRTTMYCKLDTTKVCQKCAGENLFRFREAMTQAGTAISNVAIYTMFGILKSQEVVSHDIDIEDLVG